LTPTTWDEERKKERKEGRGMKRESESRIIREFSGGDSAFVEESVIFLI